MTTRRRFLSLAGMAAGMGLHTACQQGTPAAPTAKPATAPAPAPTATTASSAPTTAPAAQAPTTGPMLTVAQFQAIPSDPPDRRLTYGDAPSQFGELRVPSGRGPHSIVVMIRGGCWKEPYAGRRDLGPLGDALKADGIATWNIEYRRLYELGSGWPGTYLDVGRALDRLREDSPEYGLDLSRVVVVGHSAGGHLAMWAAARGKLPRESQLYVANPLPVRGVVNLAVTMDMTDNISNMEALCGDNVVRGMLGGTPHSVPERHAQASVMSLVPLGVRQVLIWGEHERVRSASPREKVCERCLTSGRRGPTHRSARRPFRPREPDDWIVASPAFGDPGPARRTIAGLRSRRRR